MTGYDRLVTSAVPIRTMQVGSTAFIWGSFLAGSAMIAALIVLSVQVNRGFEQTEALRAEVIRSYESRAELERVLSLHQDIETGQRGYILTGDRSFLEPYRAASRKVTAALDILQPTWRPLAKDGETLAELRALSASKRRFAERTVALTESGRGGEARDLIVAGEGKRLMDAIRKSIASIDSSERQRLATRTRIAENVRATLQSRMVFLQVVLMVLLVTALALLVRAYLGWERTWRRERDLVASQRAVFDSARDGMLLINESGSIESINPAAAAMFRFGGDDLVRRDVTMLFDIAPDRGRVETFLKRLAAHAKSTGYQVQEFVGRRSDKSVFPAEVTVSPIEWGGRVRFLAVLRDITERHQVDQMKTEFVSTVSHELRTPLTSIGGSLGLIAGGAAGELPPRAQRLIDIAQSNCARLIRLINDILDIEKIESGRTKFDIRPVHLPHILAQAIEANRPFAASHDVAILLVSVPRNATVLGDADRLMQVLTNLLSNAAKFSPPEGLVEVWVTPLERRYRISVSNEGEGIPPEFRDRIFGKFAQADSSDTRAKGGTGLGLSIVKRIVERLGGTVSFDSAPGRGATFHVDLPAVGPTDDPDLEASPTEHPGDAELPLVLHVDDDPDMLRVVAAKFHGRARVRSVSSCAEARAAIRQTSFDAVILDITLTDGDGLELIPLIWATQQAAIVVFTAEEAEPSRLEEADLALIKSRDSLDRLIDEVELLARRRQEEPA